MNRNEKSAGVRGAYTLTYLLGLLLFGSNGIVASRIHMSSYGIVFYRTMIGSALLIALFLLGGGRFQLASLNRRHLCSVIGSGAAMGMSWMFLYEAYQRIGVGLASLLYYTGPVIVVLLSPLLFRERLTARKLLCFAVVLAGMLLTNLHQLQGEGGIVGILCALGSAVLYAFMVILNKKAESITGRRNAAIQLAVSFLTVAVFVCVRGGAGVPAGGDQWLWLLLLGLLNTGVGCYLYFSSIGPLSVQLVSVLGYLEPLSALLLSVLLLKEAFSGLQAVGAVLILGGAVLMNRQGRVKGAGGMIPLARRVPVLYNESDSDNSVQKQEETP